MTIIFSKIPSLIKEKEWSQDEYISRCRKFGISEKTAKKMQNGNTNIARDTMVRLKEVFEVQSTSELMDFA